MFGRYVYVCVGCVVDVLWVAPKSLVLICMLCLCWKQLQKMWCPRVMFLFVCVVMLLYMLCLVLAIVAEMVERVRIVWLLFAMC